MKTQKMKLLATATLLLVILGILIGSVFAYLFSASGTVSNTLAPAVDPTIAVVETFTTNPDNKNFVKKDVAVDVGDPGYAVYVRVLMVVIWRDDAGKILSNRPSEGADYTWTLNDDDWFKCQKDGFYYLKEPVNGGATPILASEIEQLRSISDGYYLHVEIIAQTVQAVGTTDENPIPAVEDAWPNVKVVNGNLQEKTN